MTELRIEVRIKVKRDLRLTAKVGNKDYRRRLKDERRTNEGDGHWKYS